MAGHGEEQGAVKPSEQSGGARLTLPKLREKGSWAETAVEGLVPTELGGSDAPPELLEDDPELGSAVLGRTTGSDEPTTGEGIDSSGGDKADATTDGGPELPDGGSRTSRMLAPRSSSADIDSAG